MTGISATQPALRPPEPHAASRVQRAAPEASARAEAPRPAAAPPPLREGEQVPMPAEISFGDFLAALNPLHHIPVVGWIYRQITGETIQPALRVLGGLVTGGPIGAIAAAVGALAEEVFGGKGEAAAATAVAEAPSAAPAPAPAPAPAASQAAATAPAAAPQPGSLAAIVTASGQPLQPLPLATRLAARAYPTPAVPLREAAPPADPASGFLPAAASLPGPGRRQEREAEAAEPSPAAAVPEPAAAAGPARLRRAPIIPVSSGGQDPAFVQQMMRGLEAYERAMRGRTGAVPPAAPQAAPAAAP